MPADDVIKAFYGDRDQKRGEDVTEKARALLRENGFLQATNSDFGDPVKGVRKISQVQYQARSREVLQQAFEETVSYQTQCVREWSNDQVRVSADCIVKATYGDADVTLTARRLLESRGWLQAAKKLAKKGNGCMNVAMDRQRPSRR